MQLCHADGTPASYLPHPPPYPHQIIRANAVVLFMKGVPSAPQCGFSAQVVRLLHSHGVEVTGVDVLSNPTLRSAMKEFSSWPTFPQLYVGGEFVGGCDIATQMHASGELGTLLAAKAGAKGKVAAAGGEKKA